MTDRFAQALHLTNGDCTDVAGTGLASRVIPWRDSLHVGPVPDVGDEELRATRTSFLTGADPVGAIEFEPARFVERDEAVEANRDGEYVLWFEADLYDQLQIVQILAQLTALKVPPERITLICIGEYAGIARFGGLGELEAAQLAELPSTAACARLSEAALDLAVRAWAALRSPRPDGLGAIAASRSGELRFLGEAYDRLAREYPSTRDGLSLTERRLLAAAADGERDAGAVFVRGAAREARPFLGDTWAFAMLDAMATAPQPLVAVEPTTTVDRRSRVRLTETGRLVLAGKEDHVSLNGVDRWIGGVHLHGRDVRWRWDEGTEEIIATG